MREFHVTQFLAMTFHKKSYSKQCLRVQRTTLAILFTCAPVVVHNADRLLFSALRHESNGHQSCKVSRAGAPVTPKSARAVSHRRGEEWKLNVKGKEESPDSSRRVPAACVPGRVRSPLTDHLSTGVPLLNCPSIPTRNVRTTNKGLGRVREKCVRCTALPVHRR